MGLYLMTQDHERAQGAQGQARARGQEGRVRIPV